jgi:hypothetical protein
MIFFKKLYLKRYASSSKVKVSSTAVIEEVNEKIGRDNLGAQAYL